jgi:hypothetical protein
MTNPSREVDELPDRGPTRMVIFFRDNGWYPLELPVSDDLASHAQTNPGTLRIEDADGNILWRPQ